MPPWRSGGDGSFVSYVWFASLTVAVNGVDTSEESAHVPYARDFASNVAWRLIWAEICYVGTAQQISAQIDN